MLKILIVLMLIMRPEVGQSTRVGFLVRDIIDRTRVPSSFYKRICDRLYRSMPYATWRSVCEHTYGRPTDQSDQDSSGDGGEEGSGTEDRTSYDKGFEIGTGSRCHVSYKGLCFRVVLQPTYNADFKTGRDLCKGQDSKLANIYSRAHFKQVEAYLRNTELKTEQTVSLWLGMKRVRHSRSVMLSSGATASGNLPWAGGYPNRGRRYTKMAAGFHRDSIRSGMVNLPEKRHLHGALCEN